MEHLELVIEGMSCAHCAARVTKALTALDGVRVGDVRVGAASLDYDPAKLTRDRIASTISDLGFRARAGA